MNATSTEHMCVSVDIILYLTFEQRGGLGHGDILFSLSYLPTAERLTVVVVKARSLQWLDDKSSADPFVKVIILDD